MTRAQARIVREKQRLQKRAERQAVTVAGSALRNQVTSYLNQVNSIEQAKESLVLVPYEPIALMMRRIYIPVGLDAGKQQRSFFTGQKQTLDQELEALLTSYIQYNLGARIQDITETTRKEILKWLAYAETEGLNWREAGKLISKNVGLNKSRSILIARTESVNAANTGALLAVKQTGLQTVKQWVPYLDLRTRPDHAEMFESAWIPTEQFFLVGGMQMMHPGDPAGGPEQCCNCRCVAIYEVVRPSQQIPDAVDSDIAAIFDSLFVPV